MSDHTFTLDGLEITLPVEWEDVPDDDGCGHPSTTGNSMTGCRGSRRVANIGYLTLDEMSWIIHQIFEHVQDQLTELEEDLT